MPGFSFILNVASWSCAVGGEEFLPGLAVAKATEEQIAEIKRALVALRQHPGDYPPLILQESKRTPLPTGRGYSAVARDRSDWRYLVVNFDDNGRKIDRLRNAALLSRQEIDLALDFMQQPLAGIRYHVSQLFYSLLAARFSPEDESVELTDSGLAELASIYRKLEEAPPEAEAEPRLRDLRELKGIDPGSRLVVLGLFGLIESILTHVPERDDRLSSITRQIRSKTNLLSRRRTDWPKASVFFSGKASSDPWPALYGYSLTSPRKGRAMRSTRRADGFFTWR
jgi:hypothetical protein